MLNIRGKKKSQPHPKNLNPSPEIISTSPPPPEKKSVLLPKVPSCVCKSIFSKNLASRTMQQYYK